MYGEVPVLIWGSARSAAMDSTLEKVGAFLLPPKSRPYFTFRWMTVFVLLIAGWNAVMKLTMKLPPVLLARFHQQETWVRDPILRVLINVGLALGLYLIYVTRTRQRYYLARVALYGMLLGGICAELLVLIPFRT
jgi:hypothetical protein